MASTIVRDYFRDENLSKHYSKHRPGYPEKVYDVIMSYHKESLSADFDFAVDVGCGTGQSTMPLADYFNKVVGCDVSESQIKHCPTFHPNVSFRVGAAEDLSFLEPGTVDMVTAATAIHWVDREKFFNEVHRVLKPHGTIAAYSYEPEYFQIDAIQQYILQVRRERLHDYLSNTKSTGVIYEKYRSVTMPMMTDVRHWINISFFQANNDEITTLACLTYCHTVHLYGLAEKL